MKQSAASCSFYVFIISSGISIDNAEFQPLIVIAELPAKNCTAAGIIGLRRGGNPKLKLRAGLDLQAVYGLRRNHATIHKCPLLIDAQEFQQAILIPVRLPPVRRKPPTHTAVIPRTCPHAQFLPIKGKE